MFFILFILFHLNIFSLYTYNSFDVLNYFESIKSNESELTIILKEISKTISEAYAYNEISKNPPQPSFDNNYHDKVDVQNLLNEINTTNISFYKFYKSLIKQISKLKDLHVDIYFNNNTIFNILKDLYSICPIKFEISKINNKYKIFGKLNQYYQYYNKKLIDKIQNNYDNNIYIVSINNLNPFTFIADFSGNNGKTKNPHGTFSHKFNAHYGYNLAIFPLDKQDLNLQIIYKNGDIINLEYIFISTYEISELTNHKNENKNDNKNDMSFKEFMNKKALENYNYKFKLSKLQKEFNKYMNLSESKNNLEEKSKINWDIQYDNNTNDIFKCKTDEINKINIYYIQSFSNDNNRLLYKESFLNCVSLFDKNIYPIIVILNKNDGGYSDLSKVMSELISPFISISKYLSIKMKDNINNKDIIQINYGDNITGYISKPIEDLIWLNNEIINNKKNIKNKRAPTDILIFTDGYSFSAAATFIKYLQYYGGAITAGFFGNPILYDTAFDSGQSSSSIFYNDTLYHLSNSYKKLNDKFNISINMPGNQNFFDDLNLNVPLEYLVTPVDERVEIYHHFKDIYYNEFIKEGLKILNKYKTRCNPNNKKLVYFTNKCNGQFENEYTFGGYKCGEDGFWSKKCVPMFCDVEYVFNHQLNKCILRARNNEIFFVVYRFLLICLFLCIIYILISFITKRLQGDKNDNNNSIEEELVDITEESEKN